MAGGRLPYYSVTLLLWLLYATILFVAALLLAATFANNYRLCLRPPFFLATASSHRLLLPPPPPTVHIFLAPTFDSSLRRSAATSATSAAAPSAAATSDHPPLQTHQSIIAQSVLSWLDSLPSARVTLLGAGPDLPLLHAVATNLRRRLRSSAAKISVEPNIDHTFRGSPQLHSIFARALQSDADISFLVMDAASEALFSRRVADALLYNPAASPLLRLRQDWVLFSRAPINSGHGGDSSRSADHHEDDVVKFWAWNNIVGNVRDGRRRQLLPLFTSALPPFIHHSNGDHDRRSVDRWIFSHITPSRAVVDATELSRLATSSNSIETLSNSSGSSSSSWESRINRFLSEADAMIDHNPTDSNSGKLWKLKRCSAEEDDDHSFCINITQQQQQQQQQHALHKANNGAGLTYSLQELLPEVADDNKLVVMVGGTSNYKEMLMSFVCRVQSLGVKSVLVAAFDDDMLEFAFRQGLAVFKENSSEAHSSAIASDTNCLFASDCFKRVSKLKSVSVLRVLKMGYSVLWSDMDVYWFENPVAELLSYGGGTLVIQSDEMDGEKAENSVRGANSGFYLARAEEETVEAMEAIVRHAMVSEMTEQPSFYDVLCGENGERRVGKMECRWRSGGGSRRKPLRTAFLSRRRYPNGFVFRLWDSDDVIGSCRNMGCVIIHNNYIQGKVKKMDRFVRQGMWFYDTDTAMCLQPWHPLSSSRLPLTQFAAHFRHSLRL